MNPAIHFAAGHMRQEAYLLKEKKLDRTKDEAKEDLCEEILEEIADLEEYAEVCKQPPRCHALSL